jgi:hypothetical protein
MKIKHDPDVGPLRQAAYPSVGDQLDAMWKIVMAMAASQVPPADALAVAAQINVVKAKFRKKPSPQ